MLRFLLLTILFFLVIRLIKYAYYNRPSVSGPRNKRNPSSPKSFDQVQDADYEIIEDEEETSGKRQK